MCCAVLCVYVCVRVCARARARGSVQSKLGWMEGTTHERCAVSLLNGSRLNTCAAAHASQSPSIVLISSEHTGTSSERVNPSASQIDMNTPQLHDSGCSPLAPPCAAPPPPPSPLERATPPLWCPFSVAETPPVVSAAGPGRESPWRATSLGLLLPGRAKDLVTGWTPVRTRGGGTATAGPSDEGPWWARRRSGGMGWGNARACARATRTASARSAAGSDVFVAASRTAMIASCRSSRGSTGGCALSRENVVRRASAGTGSPLCNAAATAHTPPEMLLFLPEVLSAATTQGCTSSLSSAISLVSADDGPAAGLRDGRRRRGSAVSSRAGLSNDRREQLLVVRVGGHTSARVSFRPQTCNMARV
jgi:hypothetical protein